MTEKQILAALQIESNEVRLLVGEVFNTRLNVIKKAFTPCKGIDGIRIVDDKAVIAAIRKVVDEANAHLGVPLESVLLAIPSQRFKKETRTFSKVMNTADRRVTSEDIKEIYEKALSVNVGNDVIVVNTTSNIYRMNGITYRKMPIGEQCDVLECDLDLLCSDKLTAYDYISVVEQAGLKVIEICLDNYAVAKEAALLEQTMRNYVLSIQVERNHTVFSLIYNGKIFTSENEMIGYSSLSRPIAQRFGLPEKNADKLLTKYAQLDLTSFTNRPIYSWTLNGVNNSLSDRELYDSVIGAADALAEDYRSLCEAILSQDNVSVLLAGDGVEIQGLDKVLSEKFGKPVKCYYPETLGAREGKWTVPLGMFYAYVDLQNVTHNESASLDVNRYLSKMSSAMYNNVHEEGFTARLKNMLFNQKNN